MNSTGNIVPSKNEHQKPLDEFFDKVNLKFAMKSIMSSRKVSPKDEVIYDPVEISQDGKVYVLTATHVPVEELVKYGQSSCKCNGKGYFVVHLEKSRIPNPQDYVILSDRRLDTMTEEEKKLWIEMQKKNKLWRIMMPCPCAIKRLSKLDSNIVSNEAGNIVAKVTYKIKEQELALK